MIIKTPNYIWLLQFQGLVVLLLILFLTIILLFDMFLIIPTHECTDRHDLLRKLNGTYIMLLLMPVHSLL